MEKNRYRDEVENPYEPSDVEPPRKRTWQNAKVVDKSLWYLQAELYFKNKNLIQLTHFT